MKIEGLRSPYVKTLGLAYFARMVDKARLNAAGKLPPDYAENVGVGFDKRCVDFLKIDYAVFRDRALKGGTDEEVLQWVFETAGPRTEEEIEIWSEFIRKRGWNDEASERVRFRLEEAGLADRTDILTMFDFIDLDEGRDPAQKTAATEI
jgi:hypothetical protein